MDGVVGETDDPGTRVLSQTLVVFALLICLFGISWGIDHLRRGHLSVGLIMLVAGGVAMPWALVAFWRDKDVPRAAMRIVGAALLATAVVTYYTGGMRGANASPYFMIMVVSIFLIGRRGAIWAIGSLAVMSLFQVGHWVGVRYPDIPEADRAADDFYSWFTGGLTLLYFAWSYERARVVSIDKLNRVNRQVSESESRYRLLAENTTDVVWTADLDGNLTYVSPSVQQLCGVPASQALQEPWSARLKPASLERFNSALTEKLAREARRPGSVDEWVQELEFVQSDGRAVWVESKVSFSREHGGRLGGLVGISRDISERRAAEDGRRRLETHLFQSQKMDAIGALSGGVAHDINNTLSVVMAVAGAVDGELPEESPFRADMQEIVSACHQATGLTSNLLSFARPRPVERTRVNLADVLTQTVELLRRTIDKNIVVELQVPDALDAVSGDQAQFAQVLINLGLNASHAMDGPGQLVFAARNVELSAAQGQQFRLAPGPHIELQVRDTGAGIPPEILARVFEPFFTTKPHGKGSGLGLAVVYSTIQNHGGAVTIDSTPGEGTTVTIRLPRAVGPDSRAAEEAAIPQATPPAGRVLIVDDEEPVCRSAARLLQSMGYDVMLAEGGRQALELYRAHAAEIAGVLLDIMMPGMDGIETFARLRTINPAVRVLFLSGRPDNQRIDGLLEAKGTAFMAKPYEKARLSAAMSELLGPRGSAC